MSNHFAQLAKSSFELREMRERIWEEWRLDCNARGIEIYQDFSEASRVGGNDPNGEEITMLIAPYKERPCRNHFPGHVCNPPRYAKIKNLTARQDYD